ncbi:hypothetical protein TNCV_3254001, partial [Trichonephila clavipes]
GASTALKNLTRCRALSLPTPELRALDLTDLSDTGNPEVIDPDLFDRLESGLAGFHRFYFRTPSRSFSEKIFKIKKNNPINKQLEAIPL